MNRPTFSHEKRIISTSKRAVIGGIDEAGRGPLAGPVVIGLVCFNQDFIASRPDNDKKKYFFEKINDSKKVSLKVREKLAWYIKDLSEFSLAVSISPTIIDQVNILNASLWGFKKAYLRANQSGQNISDLLIDGPKGFAGNNDVRQTPIVNGDAVSISIASASILAKTTRDKLMLDYHRKYPEYHFDRHKGYGTKLHYEMLTKYGPCPIHRRSFRLK